ncbi:carboxymuconolactone decarboxylase family protein [Parasphingorhabdus sp.]|uniref:carboxymuconolactone decarboxylase family protein n=1 Tax=Parasphingorhabdus sp. TaxID=2709688 RepID=UPI003D2A0FDD
MSNFETLTVETAPEGSKPLLESVKKASGFVPNLLGTMAPAPALLEGYLSLSGIFSKTNLSETERQIILMTNNRLNKCFYCMAAHTTLSQMSGVSEEVIEALRNNTPISDSKLEALRVFAGVINETRGWPSDKHLSDFLSAGYDHQTVLEVILGTSLKVMSNYTNHVAETQVDDAFTANSWSPLGEAAIV